MRKRKMTWFLTVAAAIFLIAPDLVATGPESGGQDTNPTERTWTVAVLADLNGPYGSTEYDEHVTRAVEWIRTELEPDLVVVAGDMVAGQREELDYPAMWEAFHDVVTDRLAEAQIPMAVTPGNHDASEQPRFWMERIEFARQWNMRRPHLRFVDDAFYPFHYAFEMGPALFVSLDGTGVGDLDAAQLAWLDGVLEEHSHLELSILLSHVPQYAVAEGRQREIFDDDRLAELLEKHDVDMMISGHHHAYFPARRHGTYLLHAACLGSGPRPLLGDSQRSPRNVAVIRFGSQGIEEVKAFESPEFNTVVDHGELPESVGKGELRIWREDIAVETPDS